MTDYDVKYHIARLTSGSFTFKVDGRWYITKPPSALAIMMSREVRLEIEHSACQHELMSHEAALRLLIEYKLWNDEDEEKLHNLRRYVDDYLVQLYEQRESPEQLKQTRVLLLKTREMLGEFENRRSYFDHLTTEHAVEEANCRFLCGCSLYHYDGTAYWRDPETDRSRSDHIIETAMRKIREAYLSQTSIRKLARSPYWIMLWNSKDQASLLVDQPVSQYLDEFTHLLRWTRFYEDVRVCDDPPSEDVIEDDDLIDGWRIIRDRQNKVKANMAQNYKKYVGKEFDRADEVFVVAKQGSEKEVAAFTSSAMSDFAKKRRENTVDYIKSDEAKEISKCFDHGSVPIGVFPETTNRLGMDRNKLLKNIRDKAQEQEREEDFDHGQEQD